MINTSEMITGTHDAIREVVDGLTEAPKLVIIQVGNNPASNSYVKNKVKLGEKLNIQVEHICMNDNISESDLIDEVNDVNDSDADGVIVQLPLPKHLNERLILDSIHPSKDVDGLGSIQIGKLHTNSDDTYEPCTAFGVMSMLSKLTPLKGKDIVIVNRSHLIGLPLQKLLTDANATVTLCHSKTINLERKIRNADIVITGIGTANHFDSEWFSDGQIIIDCSMNMYEGKLCGDVLVDDVLNNLDVDIASGKGHTGPFTTTCLMINTVRSAILSGK